MDRRLVVAEFLLDSSGDSDVEDSTQIQQLYEVFSSDSSCDIYDNFKLTKEESDPLINSPVVITQLSTASVNRFTDDEFKNYFQLERKTVRYLIKRYETSLLLPDISANKLKIVKMDHETEFYLYLCHVTNIISYRQLGILFGIEKLSVRFAVRKVCHWLITIGHEFVKWPEANNYNSIASKFEKIKKIPGIIGVIDCTNIRIRPPPQEKHNYYDRNGDYSIILQAVVDPDYNFLDLFIGEFGALHDNHVLKRSDLFRIATVQGKMFYSNFFIIGDEAYRCTNWLISPYRNDNSGSLTDGQIHFNEIHSSTRMVIHTAFNKLKTRFKRLEHLTDETNLCRVTNIVMSCCILHNICNIFNDDIKTDVPVYDNYASNPITFNNKVDNARRKTLFEYLLKKGII